MFVQGVLITWAIVAGLAFLTNFLTLWLLGTKSKSFTQGQLIAMIMHGVLFVLTIAAIKSL